MGRVALSGCVSGVSRSVVSRFGSSGALFDVGGIDGSIATESMTGGSVMGC